MYVMVRQEREDQWRALVRLETHEGWRCFQAVGDSRVGALIHLRSSMWRYQGAAYDQARQAVIAAALPEIAGGEQRAAA